METIILLVLLGAAMFLVARWSLSRAESRRVAGRREQIRRACQEAKTIVDLATPAARSSILPDTALLSEISRRIERLDRRMHQLSQTDITPLIRESMEDVCRVASSLAAAIDAERSFRLGNQDGAGPHRAQSAERIASRSHELNAAADELRWLVETED